MTQTATETNNPWLAMPNEAAEFVLDRDAGGGNGAVPMPF